MLQVKRNVFPISSVISTSLSVLFPSVFLNDGNQPGSWSYLNWYYHFAAEAILGGFTSLASITTPFQERDFGDGGVVIAHTEPEKSPSYSLVTEVSRLLIPWEETWRDGYGVNEVVARAGFSRMSSSNRLFALIYLKV
jgi:hypothetical protein